jgi:hypothetical protein
MTNNPQAVGNLDDDMKSYSVELYEQIFRSNPTLSDNMTVRGMTANVKNSGFEALAELIKEKEDNEEYVAKIIDAGDAITNAREEQIRREREEYYADKVVEFDGMQLKGREWRAIHEIMVSDDFKRRMRDEGIRKGYTASQIDEAERIMPQIADQLARGQQPTADQQRVLDNNPAARDSLDAAQNRAIGFRSANERNANFSKGEARIESRADAFSNASTTAPVTSSVAKTMDEKSASVATMLPAFNTASNGDVSVAPVQAVAPKPDVAMASNAGFNMNAGAI